MGEKATAFDKGINARRKGRGLTENPYHRGTANRRKWTRGWRDEDKVITTLSPPTDLNLAAAWRQ